MTVWALAFAGVTPLAAQVTTAAFRGRVADDKGNPLEGARIEALHVPSGTRYAGIARADGSFTLAGLRVGGPYTVSAARIGFQRQAQDDLQLALGTSTDLVFRLSEAASALQAVTVTATDGIISAQRTGAATAVDRRAVENLPTISRRIGDFTRLTPQASGSSFAGQDNRLNNITVDGSFFNNQFGLGGQPGDRTGVAPISLDAIEQIQVNIAPYDVRQGNFVGAGVNTVTRSGTNEFQGSLYYLWRNEGLVGNKAAEVDFRSGTFDFSQIGARVGGPIIKDKLFFFASFEDDGIEEPGTTFRANTGGQTVGGQTTRVLASDLNRLRTFLTDRFDFDPGTYEGYNNETPSRRFLGKVDFNVNDRNKLSLRYTHLDSETDVLLSNSASLGFGSRRSNTTGLNFSGSNYTILENIRSIVGEWNSIIGDRLTNNLIVGYTKQDESRGQLTTLFPMVDILEAGAVYTTFGSEPFTPNNELRYSSFQLQNNLTWNLGNHDLVFGLALERYESENVFFPGSQSAYVYNSLNDFFTDAEGFLANPNRTTSPVTLRRFQVRYANIPGQTKPVQPLEVLFGGVYLQDEWRARPNLRITAGLRVDVPRFGDTGFENPQVANLNFRDEDGATVRYNTGKLPDANPLFSPRLGFNWDVRNDGSTQVRGGTGIFTGRPAYVWISNQIGNNGIITGFEQLDNTTARPFNPNPDRYKPTSVTGAPAASYELALTDPEFRFPQLWRSNIAVDRKLPWGFVGTAEFLYSRDVNGIYYINANLPAAQTAFTGPDNRPRWTSNRINSNITNAIVLKNQNVGSAYNIAFSLERAFRGGFFAKGAYSYGISENTVDPGSIAAGTWFGNPVARDPNNPQAALSGAAAGHRFFLTTSYQKQWFRFGQTGISAFFEGRQLGNTSYTFSGDLNGDGGTGNDLIYVARNPSEMVFQQFTASGRTFTVAEQQAAWEAYIQQDRYLKDRRGQYAERGALWLPMLYNLDLSITQDLFTNVRGKRNGIQLRADILNATNLLSSDWGVAQRVITTQPLIAAGADAQGRAQYRLRNFGNQLLQAQTFEKTANPNDVWRLQLGIRYLFN
jgi:outer membrane receptor protein involved in Fe transport